jgi:glycine/D-amino acid oxidase-like deaminating enzyme
MELYVGNSCMDEPGAERPRFGKLDEDLKVDVLIVGGGLSGTLCAHVLSSAGLSVAVVERNKLGSGSTAVQTGLLMYKSDRMLCELACEIGEEKAVRFYRMCLEAMGKLNSIGDELGEASEYRLRDSIYYASSEKDAEKLRREYDLLSKHGFPVEYLGREELKRRYSVEKACALRTWRDAEINPLKFSTELVKKNIRSGVRYYEDTEADLGSVGGGSVRTADGRVITSDYIVLATGYSELYTAVRDKCSITRTYAFCSEPVDGELWRDEVMVWETKMPYLYFRTTSDRRIIGGGLDEELDFLERDEEKVSAKAAMVASEIEAIFPHLNIKVSHTWNALFGTSADGMPFLGRDPEDPRLFYLLGYEGNGTCYSMAGSTIIKKLILGEDSQYHDIVRVDR